jgi:hypothetical protein
MISLTGLSHRKGLTIPNLDSVARYVIPAESGIRKFPMGVSGCRSRACTGVDPRYGMTGMYVHILMTLTMHAALQFLNSQQDELVVQ